ncbi:MAG TPA: multicopper oxidase domain-containing protein [Rhizomicrobium sp.]|nr:multicopper oxidase domain-containing protein [Rhizomicrobium sp.]
MKAFAAALVLTFLTAAGVQAKATDGGVCPRPAAGSIVEQPADLYSSNNVLNVTFDYYTSVDDGGRTLFCLVTPDGQESPTLHVNPGDTLKVTLNNMIPADRSGPAEIMFSKKDSCADTTMTDTSVNLHFHGTNVSPKCGSDEVIHTLVNSGDSFVYTIKIPANEPPGLYWYHPHVHTLSESALLGGASGVIEVEGIANIQPAVAGLPQRYLTIRDQSVVTNPIPGKGPQPSWDISLNYVPISYPEEKPAVIQMQAGQQELWRVTNASADTIADIQLKYDNAKQNLQVVALDGVPTGSQDGKRQGTIVTEKDLLLPPAGRAEFIVTAPSADVKKAQLITEAIDIGHSGAGDLDPKRVLAKIQDVTGPLGLSKIPKRSGPPNVQRFENLADAKVTTSRLLYFSEVGFSLFFITVDGQDPVPFDPNNPPAITTTQGAVEEWTIENRSPEVHEFHIHQIHFLLTAINGKKIPKKKQQFYDTYQVGYWPGGGPYPSITAKMDFRGATVGDFVYHCHILKHEDHGMMAIIRVQKPAS